jgi:hypothetical protein
MKRIEVHVDQLVLDGMPPHQARAVAQAVARALSRSLAERGLGASILAGPQIEQIHAGPLTLAPSAPPAEAGSRIGHTVAAALAAPGRKP